MKLAQLQHFFARAVTTGSGPVEGLEDVFLGSASLSASARLAIYNRAYYHRLLDSLAAVFSSTRRMIGESAFERFGLRYISDRPSDHPAVEQVGQNFAEYLCKLADSMEPMDARERAVLRQPIADVALLEWARLCSLVAPDAARLATTNDIEPNGFPDCQLRFVPCLQLLELDPRALAALPCADRAPLAETAESEVGGCGDRRRIGVAVFRHGHAVRHEELPALEYRALFAAHSGKRMAEVCALFDTGCSEADAQYAFRVISHWFARDWVEGSVTPSA